MSRADKQAAWPRHLVHWCRACPCCRSVVVVNTPLDHRVLSIHFVPSPLPRPQGPQKAARPRHGNTHADSNSTVMGSGKSCPCVCEGVEVWIRACNRFFSIIMASLLQGRKPSHATDHILDHHTHTHKHTTASWISTVLFLFNQRGMFCCSSGWPGSNSQGKTR